MTKRYFEILADSSETALSGSFAIGIGKAEATTTDPLGSTFDSFGYYASGVLLNNNTTVASGSGYSKGDIIGFKVDYTTGDIFAYVNNTLNASATGVVTAGMWYPMAILGQNDTASANFSAEDWVYNPGDSYGYDGIEWVPYQETYIWDFTNALGVTGGAPSDSTAVVSDSVGGIQGFTSRNSGQRFFRILPNTFPTDDVSFYGLVKDTYLSTALGQDLNSVGLIRSGTNGGIFTNGAIEGWVYPFSTADPIDIYVDFDTGIVTFVVLFSVSLASYQFSASGETVRPAFSGASGDEAVLVTDFASLDGSQYTGFETFLPWEDNPV